MARAKHTSRAEARRRYRQATSHADADADLLLDEGAPEATAGAPRSAPRANDRPSPQPSGRPSFTAAFREAYHPAHLREDLAELPTLVRSRALLGGLALVLAGGISTLMFPNYTGSAFAWELLVLPGSALAPQLVAGFFAPRASYLLGFIVGLFQGLVFTLVVLQIGPALGSPIPADQIGNLLTLSFVTGPISGTLFAAAAAWYRRFLRLSSPRRAQAGRAGSGRGSTKSSPARRSGR